MLKQIEHSQKDTKVDATQWSNAGHPNEDGISMFFSSTNFQ